MTVGYQPTFDIVRRAHPPTILNRHIILNSRRMRGSANNLQGYQRYKVSPNQVLTHAARAKRRALVRATIALTRPRALRARRARSVRKHLVR